MHAIWGAEKPQSCAPICNMVAQLVAVGRNAVVKIDTNFSLLIITKMVHIPTDIIRLILSYHPVKNPNYDICMDQLKYFAKMHKSPSGCIYCNPSFYHFILRHNRSKMLLFKKKST
jgi:hypothetical protein